jgi:large subunit ribosomal protein L10
MAITKEKKKEILEKLRGVTDKESVVFVNFKNFPVEETTQMRSKLREDDISYLVAKKTLVRKAFDESKVEGELPELEGELAIAYGDDKTASARGIYAFQKEFEENIQILGGVFENKYLSKSEMEEIAKIPGMDVLRGMFVNVINSPIQGLVLTLKAYADKQEA